MYLKCTPKFLIFIVTLSYYLKEYNCIDTGKNTRSRSGESLSRELIITLFFCRPIRRPKTTGKSPPHSFRLGRVSSATPPPHRSRSSVGCCVY